MGNPDTISSTWDAFISHASEDKDSFVPPLAQSFASLGAIVWYDEFTLKLGDSLSQSIDRGLAQSRYGVVVISSAFMSKPWPQRELAGLVTRELDGHSAILPVWHAVTRSQVATFSPPLADKLAVRTADATAIDIALQILQVIRPDIYDTHPRRELEKIANGEAIADMQDKLASLRNQLSEFQCPYCGSRLTGSVDAPMDPEEKHWDVVPTFECGYRDYGGSKDSLCPSDPEFPSFNDYELIHHCKESAGQAAYWTRNASPQTEPTRRVRLPQVIGPTKEAATAEIRREYEQRAKPWM